MSGFEVKGMSCGYCVKAITQAIKTLDANAKVVVDLAGGKVCVENSQLTDQKIIAAIDDAG